MNKNRIEFDSGPKLKDTLLWLSRTFVIAYIFIILMMMGIAFFVVFITGDLLGFFLIIPIFIGFMLLTIPLVLPIILLAGILRYYINYSNSKNTVEMTTEKIYINVQRSFIYPIVSNTIEISKIRKVEEGEKNYIHQVRKNTPKWYFALTLLHRIPHGGLYIPIVSKKDLIILYLNEPVDITNNNIKNIMYRGLKIESHPVMEVIIDVKTKDHEMFMDLLKDRMRLSKLKARSF